MAWVIGVVTEEELQDLRSRGWRDEDAAGMLPDDVATGSQKQFLVRAFFVDSDLYTIMTGPDWEGPVMRKAREQGEST